MSMEEIMEKLKALQQDNFTAIQERLKFIGKDKISLFCERDGVSSLRELIKKKTIGFDFNYDVVLYFYEDNTYIQFFENELRVNYQDIFEDKLQDYHYQNQSDAWYCFDMEENTPEYEQAEIEWDERERVWDGILSSGSGIPMNCGLTFNVFSEKDSFMVEYNFRYNTEIY